MVWPYFRTGSPAESSRSAILWPRGMFCAIRRLNDPFTNSSPLWTAFLRTSKSSLSCSRTATSSRFLRAIQLKVRNLRRLVKAGSLVCGTELLSTVWPKNAISRPLTVSIANFSCLISKQVHVEVLKQRNFRGETVNYPQSRCRGRAFLCKVTIAAQSYENPTPPHICFYFLLPQP